MRIFVTVGTTEFHQLTDALAATELLAGHQLIIQCGSVRPKEIRPGVVVFDYANNILNHIAEADLIISHAAAGTRLDVIGQGKPHIMVCNDSLAGNHQMEMIRANEDNKSCRVFDSVEAFLEYLAASNLEKECEAMAQSITNKAEGERQFKDAIWSTIQWKRPDPLPRMLLGIMICFVSGLCLIVMFTQ